MKNSFTRFFGFGDKGEQEAAVGLEEEIEIEVERNEEIKKIPIDQIVPNRFQPHSH